MFPNQGRALLHFIPTGFYQVSWLSDIRNTERNVLVAMALRSQNFFDLPDSGIHRFLNQQLQVAGMSLVQAKCQRQWTKIGTGFLLPALWCLGRIDQSVDHDLLLSGFQIHSHCSRVTRQDICECTHHLSACDCAIILLASEPTVLRALKTICILFNCE